MQLFFRKIPGFLKWLFIVTGVIFCIMIVLSFTDIPYYAYYRLGTSNSKITSVPDVIVVLGGSGMPSPEGLIRTYYANLAAHKYSKAEIIIALPYSGKDSLKQLRLMAEELTVKGIDSARIRFEPLGFNTRSQAMNVASMFNSVLKKPSLIIVTSPEHMFRSVKTFRKAGLNIIGGIPAFEYPVDPDKIRDNSDATDFRVKSLSLRYNMWSYLDYEFMVIREYTAIAYYKLKGWL